MHLHTHSFLWIIYTFTHLEKGFKKSIHISKAKRCIQHPGEAHQSSSKTRGLRLRGQPLLTGAATQLLPWAWSFRSSFASAPSRNSEPPTLGGRPLRRRTRVSSRDSGRSGLGGRPRRASMARSRGSTSSSRSRHHCTPCGANTPDIRESINSKRLFFLLSKLHI